MELVVYHGMIHTMDEAKPLAQAALIRDGVFAAVGSEEEILALADEKAQRLDLENAGVYPGLVDSHLHILNLAITSRELELNDFRCRNDVLRAVAMQAAACPAGSFLDGRGFNEDLWDEKRLITCRELDEIAPNHAVRLTRVCGHLVVANRMAMEKLGITPDTQAPAGGEFDYERGVFVENAINLLFPAQENADVELCKELLYEGMSKAADAGLTAIYSDDFGTGGYPMQVVAAAYRALEREGRMPVRVVEQCALPDDESWEEFLAAGFAYGQGSDWFRIGPRKLYADGSLGARTACLSVPYADSPAQSGVPIYPQQELNRLAEQTHRAGMPFIVHAIGDAASESVVEAVRHARRAVPGSDALPDGIVHCQITTPKLLEEIAQEKICVYAQPVFAEYDLHICRSRVGEALEKSSYNWKTLLHSGVCISSGSDCPVEPLDPAKNIYCAVARKDFAGYPPEGWMPEQRLTVSEALECHTLQAARAIGMEARMGKIAVGYLGDLSVFPRSLDSIAPDELLTQKPIMTIVGGRVRRCPV